MNNYWAGIVKNHTQLLSHAEIMTMLQKKNNNPDKIKLIDVAINTILRTNLPVGLNVSFTIGYVNAIYYELAGSLLEIYISPGFSQANIPQLEELYKCRPTLDNIIVNKYMPYNSRSDICIDGVMFYPIIHNISYIPFVLEPNDITISVSNAIDDNKPKKNIIFVVDEKIAPHIISKRKIGIIQPDSSEMFVYKYLPFHSNLYLVINIIIGEYHFLNTVSYVEFYPKNESGMNFDHNFEDICKLSGHFVDISNIYQSCSFCSKKSYQCDLFMSCEYMGKMFCSKFCEIAGNKSRVLK